MPPPYHFSSGQADDAYHQESNLLISTKGEPQSQMNSASIKAMDEHGGVKVNGIRQIVRLKELLQKWQNVTLNSRLPNNHQHGRPHPGGISPDVNRRLKSAVTACDSDEEGCPSPDSPPDVPKGYLAVYVGPEVRRFIIPTAYLSHNLFKVLLEKAEEEFGFDHGGGLTLPCEIETFKYLLNCIENENMNKEGHPTDIAEGSATEA